MRIEVWDSIMGSGKTQRAIKKMNEEEGSFIYITPFLSEVERIKENVVNKKFYDPKNFSKGKMDSLKRLIIDGKNIVSTHALFSTADDELMELLKIHDYTLILDEVMDVIDTVNMSVDDIEILLRQGFLVPKEDGYVDWNDHALGRDRYKGNLDYTNIRNMAMHNRLILYNNMLLLWTFPVDVFMCFKEVYILTYMFDGQIMKYYYDLHNLEYNYKSVRKIDEEFRLVDYTDNKKEITPLINILYDNKLNLIGDKDFSLSYNWYNKNFEGHLETLRKHLVNFFINKCKAKSKDILWTTFLGDEEKYRKALSAKGYKSKKCFAPITARATNEYSDRKYLAYTVNRFMNPFLARFFNNNEVSVNEDIYALSEMLQWIFRSAIRNGEEINIYVPSKRMRNLLENWIKN